jgi:hypothetical protein
MLAEGFATVAFEAFGQADDDSVKGFVAGSLIGIGAGEGRR